MTKYYISETEQLNTLQRRLNWYLNETDVSLRPYSNILSGVLAIIFDIWSLISFQFIKNENNSEHLH